MERRFSAGDAKRLIGRHQVILGELRENAVLAETLRGNVRAAADSLVAREILQVLRGIPVEELAKQKKGLRTKPLSDHGYATVGDIYPLSVYNLAAINGISQTNANTIKRLTESLAEQTRRETKIQLSLDDKNKESSALVKALAIYKNCLPLCQQCGALDEAFGTTVERGVVAVRRATNIVRWLFTSKANKEQALTAYDELNAMLSGIYGTKATQLASAINKVLHTTATVAWQDFAVNNVQFYNLLEETNPGLLGTDDAIYGLPEDLAREIQDQCFFPDGLKCTLRRYQEWGVRYILHQEKVLLGDEMGLGKTIQAIATMVSLKNTGATHFVVVCPASVVTNWCREITKHSLLTVTKVHGAGRARSLQAWRRTGGVAVTTYETTAYFQLDDDFGFELLVVDEAHYIKNPEAKRTVHTQKLGAHAKRLLFMTGTALENRVDEMITLIEMLQPAVARQVEKIAFMATAPQFRAKVAPVYYRRKREDVLTELPELTESKEWCPLSRVEEEAYETAVLAKNLMAARRVSWNVEDLTQSAKANRLKEIVAEATLENRKVLVFSFFLETIQKIKQLLGAQCLTPINGAVSPQRRQAIIDEFNSAPPGTVLVAQIQSGGTGLNIQCASVVVICEPQFKPSIENQAISRSYRMGQARNVLVYRLLCEGTIDERITEILEEKQQQFLAFADRSVSAEQNLALDEKSFNKIIEAEIERIKRQRSHDVSGQNAVGGV